MSDLGLSADAQPSDNFATISDVSVQSASNRVDPNQIASGVSRGIQQLGSSKVYADGGKNQIIVEDTSTPRVLMGSHDVLGQGFFVSKSGINVKTNTDTSQLIFNSNQNVFKIVKTGVASLPVLGVSDVKTTTIPHGLSFIPAGLVFQTDPSTGLYLQLPRTDFVQGGASDGKMSTNWYWSVDATNLTIAAYTSASSGGYVASTYRYYLLQETASSS